VPELNYRAARLARAAADELAQRGGGPRFVAGALGPTNRMTSMSPDVNDPGHRSVSFDELVAAYLEAARGLLLGGVDLLLIETVFDTLNAKAAIYAAFTLFDETGITLPLALSGTITDASGRLLSGQTTEAFWNSIRMRSRCSSASTALSGPAAAALHRGARRRRRYLRVRVSERRPPQRLRRVRRGAGRDGRHSARVWRVGPRERGGRVLRHHPEHIRLLHAGLRDCAPRRLAPVPVKCRLAGLEALNIDDDSLFVNVGERTNVTGSAKFRKLIEAGDYAAALEVARQQVVSGAQIIDVNMDEGMLDSQAAMVRFLNLVAVEPDIARVPVMIDSSKWSVIEAGLKCVQGKPIVNSISLKEGEQVFIEHARTLRRHGAAAVIMAFDEQGQADTVERRLTVCARAYRILTERVSFPPRTSSSTPIFSPSLPASRNTTATAWRLSRLRAASSASCRTRW